MRKELFYAIQFRLFWDDKPVGFQMWDNIMGDSYTYGNPENKDGCKNCGWHGIKIPHNRKEILSISYVTPEYLEEERKNKEFWKETFHHINNNLPIINHVRKEQGLEPLTKIL